MFFSYLVVEHLVEIVVADDIDFPYVLLDVEDTLDLERLIAPSLDVRSCCSKCCDPYLCWELCVDQLVGLILVVTVVL